MKSNRTTVLSALTIALVMVASPLCAQQPASSTSTLETASEPVNIDNFVRAETDTYFRKRVEEGRLGKFVHDREPAPIDKQTVIRMNRDTPFSLAIFDLTNPVTIVKPDTGGRFQSIMVINQDHYIQQTIHKPGTYTFTQKEMGTRYIQMTVRTFVDPNDPKDVAELVEAQDGLKVIQASPGTFEAPNWDQTQLNAVRKSILAMSPWVADSKRMFGREEETTEVRHLIGTAGGFGGNSDREAIYLHNEPKDDDGKTAYTLTVKDVPVDGFWSVTVYNKDGFFEAPANTISVNNVTAKKNPDGATVIHFGGDPKAPNYLRIMPGWNYMVRLYLPRTEILDGTWKFPQSQVAK